MFWIRLFWLEAIVVPVVFLYLAGSAPTTAPYRTLNLIVWGIALAVGVGGYAVTQWKKRRAARS